MQLLQGDCLKLMKDIPNGSVDMVLCDLPYGTTRNAWDKCIDLKQLFSEYGRIVRSGGGNCFILTIAFQCGLDKRKQEALPV